MVWLPLALAAGLGGALGSAGRARLAEALVAFLAWGLTGAFAAWVLTVLLAPAYPTLAPLALAKPCWAVAFLAAATGATLDRSKPVLLK
ncbi:MAG: hypothetical protein U1E65_32940 [Myxococcota bacterium]